ncbi:hypothetical protein [Arthrobacter sp. JSM 101049]|uniref:PH-like domain-containing protein n=1 Tax=Arthrobacter sp. JSM 101049 TaxID=929097 RepID=UPI0035655E26
MNEYIPYLIGIVVVAVAAVALMRLGWRHRQARQADVAAPPAVPGDLDAPLAAAAGQYVSTTTAGDWLDRISVHGLGMKSTADLTIHPQGVLFSRGGAPDVYIPAADLESVRRESGMAGKFVEAGGLLVLGWRLGGHHLDTGFRPQRAADMAALVAAAESLIPDAGPAASTDDRTAPKKDKQ